MAQVAIQVNGRTYRLGCREGDEARLSDLAAMLDRHMRSLTSEFGRVGDERLLVMAGLMVADELYDARQEVAQLREALDAAAVALPTVDRDAGEEAATDADTTPAQALVDGGDDGFADAGEAPESASAAREAAAEPDGLRLDLSDLADAPETADGAADHPAEDLILVSPGGGRSAEPDLADEGDDDPIDLGLPSRQAVGQA